jgi:hypothetical protein
MSLSRARNSHSQTFAMAKTGDQFDILDCKTKIELASGTELNYRIAAII